MGVVVPACNEELLVARCLRSIQEALAYSGLTPDRTHAVVVADGCTDRTAALAARIAAGWGEVVEIHDRCVGRARRAGASRVLERFTMISRERLWLANTDADTTVPPSWIASQLELATMGVAGIAGVVDVDSFAEHSETVRRRYARHYEGDGDWHPHIHGANLGVRADAYLAAGGWPIVHLAEDETLWRTLIERGWPTTSTRSLAVTTSGRAVGRAPGGLADFLTGLGEGR